MPHPGNLSQNILFLNNLYCPLRFQRVRQTTLFKRCIKFWGWRDALDVQSTFELESSSIEGKVGQTELGWQFGKCLSMRSICKLINRNKKIHYDHRESDIIIYKSDIPKFLFVLFTRLLVCLGNNRESRVIERHKTMRHPLPLRSKDFDRKTYCFSLRPGFFLIFFIVVQYVSSFESSVSC